MTEISTIDWFGRWEHLFSLKTLLYFIPVLNSEYCLQIKQMSILPRYLNSLIEIIKAGLVSDLLDFFANKSCA